MDDLQYYSILEKVPKMLFRFSTRTFIAMWVVLCCCAATVRLSPMNVAPVAIVMLPCIVFIVGCHRYWLAQGTTTSLDYMVRMFCIGFFPGSLVLFAVELIATLCFAYVCFGNDIMALFPGLGEHEKEVNVPDGLNTKNKFVVLWGFTSPIRGLVFILLSSFITAGLLEEALKLGIAVRRSSKITNGDNTSRMYKAYRVLSSILAFSLGFAACESIAFICFGEHSLRHRITLAFGRVVFALPMHVSCGCATGLGLVKRHILQDRLYASWSKVLGPAVLAHGVFDLQAFLIAGAQVNQLISTSNAIWVSSLTSSIIMVYSVLYVRDDLANTRRQLMMFVSSTSSGASVLPQFQTSKQSASRLSAASVRADGSVKGGLLSTRVQRLSGREQSADALLIV